MRYLVLMLSAVLASEAWACDGGGGGGYGMPMVFYGGGYGGCGASYAPSYSPPTYKATLAPKATPRLEYEAAVIPFKKDEVVSVKWIKYRNPNGKLYPVPVINGYMPEPKEIFVENGVKKRRFTYDYKIVAKDYEKQLAEKGYVQTFEKTDKLVQYHQNKYGDQPARLVKK